MRLGTAPAMATPGADTTGAAVNLDDGESAGSVRRRRRVMMNLTSVLIIAVFIAGITNVVGVRGADARDSGGGYELSVRYGAVSRGGLATPFDIEVRHGGGFPGPVRVAVRAHYFDLFDANSLDPQPSSQTTLGDWLVWEFDRPPGETLRISYDARIEPARQLGSDGWVGVLDDDDRPVAQVAFTTILLP